MAKMCDFYLDRGSKYICMAKKDEISYDTYKEYCKHDEKRKCPIYRFYLAEKEGKTNY